MKLRNNLRGVPFLCGIAVVTCLLGLSPTVPAQHGGSGGGPGGTIFFMNGGSTNYLWSMSANGSELTQIGYYGTYSVPSNATHGGHRWYLTVKSIAGSYYGDGVTLRSGVFLCRDDYDPNNSATYVQVVDSMDLEPQWSWFRGMQWMANDLRVSFRARRWVGAVPVDGGIYTVDVAFDQVGNIVGPASGPALAFACPLGSNGSPVIDTYSWDPTESKLACTDTTAPGLWVADTSNGTKTLIYNSGITYPDWSGDGTKIVFGLGSSVCTIKPNGSGLKQVLRPFSSWTAFGHAVFSPAGDYILCTGWNSANGGNDELVRITSIGNSFVNLTNTPTTNEISICWH